MWKRYRDIHRLPIVYDKVRSRKNWNHQNHHLFYVFVLCLEKEILEQDNSKQISNKNKKKSFTGSFHYFNFLFFIFLIQSQKGGDFKIIFTIPYPILFVTLGCTTWCWCIVEWVTDHWICLQLEKIKVSHLQNGWCWFKFIEFFFLYNVISWLFLVQ